MSFAIKCNPLQMLKMQHTYCERDRGLSVFHKKFEVLSSCWLSDTRVHDTGRLFEIFSFCVCVCCIQYSLCANALIPVDASTKCFRVVDMMVISTYYILKYMHFIIVFTYSRKYETVVKLLIYYHNRKKKFFL